MSKKDTPVQGFHLWNMSLHLMYLVKYYYPPLPPFCVIAGYVKPSFSLKIMFAKAITFQKIC